MVTHSPTATSSTTGEQLTGGNGRRRPAAGRDRRRRPGHGSGRGAPGRKRPALRAARRQRRFARGAARDRDGQPARITVDRVDWRRQRAGPQHAGTRRPAHREYRSTRGPDQPGQLGRPAGRFARPRRRYQHGDHRHGPRPRLCNSVEHGRVGAAGDPGPRPRAPPPAGHRRASNPLAPRRWCASSICWPIKASRCATSCRSGIADRAGIRPDDIIVALAGRLVTSIDDLHRLLMTVPAEQGFELTIVRGDKMNNVHVYATS